MWKSVLSLGVFLISGFQSMKDFAHSTICPPKYKTEPMYGLLGLSVSGFFVPRPVWGAPSDLKGLEGATTIFLGGGLSNCRHFPRNSSRGYFGTTRFPAPCVFVCPSE
ncbi:UNVERIFIED_CONTAM: hypothetical protein K2H54_019640 [Gekko kuhli]